MKKLLIVILSIAAVSLTSCLKDKPNTDFSSIGTVIELPYAGIQYAPQDAVTDPGDTITKSFGVNIASAKPLSTDTKYTLAVDTTLIAKYEATNSLVTYIAMPPGSYTISKTSGTIKAGQRLDSVTVTFYKNQLDPSKSYMLPIALKSTSNGILSGNFNAHFYHFIGNDFAGNYTWDYYRYNADHVLPTPSGGTTLGQAGSILPITANEFQMITGYNGNHVRYDVTFTKTVSGGVATYSNWNLSFVASDVTNVWGGIGITNTQPPVFLTLDPVTKHFKMQYIDFNGTAFRYIIDDYYKP